MPKNDLKSEKKNYKINSLTKTGVLKKSQSMTHIGGHATLSTQFFVFFLRKNLLLSYFFLFVTNFARFVTKIRMLRLFE